MYTIKKRVKKLVLVLAIFALIIGISKEVSEVIVDQVPCFYYPVQFWKDKRIIKALINSSNKVNAITLAYVK